MMKIKIKDDDFINDLIITFVGQMLVMILSFILNKVISNQYSVESFGVYNLIKRSASVVSFMMLMAMGIAIPKYIAEATEKKNAKETESYMLSGLFIILSAFVVISTVLLIFQDFFSELMFKDRNAVVLILPICLFSLGSSIVTYVYSFYRGVNNFVKYNRVNLIMQMGMLLLAFAAPRNFVALHYIWSAFLIIYGILGIWGIFKNNNISFYHLSEKLFTLKTMLEYAVPRVPGECILFAYNLVPLVIITDKFGLENVAYFSAALSINSLISPLFSLVGTILLPLVSKSLVNNNKENMVQKIRILGWMYLIVSVLAVLVVYFIGEWLLILLYNKNYVQCINIVKITILSIVPNAFYLLLRNPLDGISKYPYNTICLLISFVVYVGVLAIAPTMEVCGIALILAYSLLGGLSFAFWKYALKKTGLKE
ncbi:MAG: MATE family efflux transporter [Roseburia sp.]|nr:MATE family efflux transporter [Roseburia sp.]